MLCIYQEMTDYGKKPKTSCCLHTTHFQYKYKTRHGVACHNLSYLRGGDLKDCCSRQVRERKWETSPISNNKLGIVVCACNTSGQVKMWNPDRKITNSQTGLWYGSSGRVPANQAWEHELKLQYHQKVIIYVHMCMYIDR
jgi:hypothetical protein